MTRWWPLLAVLAAVLLTTLSDAWAEGHCDRHLRDAVLRTPKVLVFTRPSQVEDGARRFYACRRHGDPAIFIALDLPDDDFYGSDSVVWRVRARGTTVSVMITENAASRSACTKYVGENCPVVRVYRRVVDTRTRTITDFPVSG